MEEKRYYYNGLGEDIYDSEIDDYPSNQTICDTLNNQHNKIKELEEENKVGDFWHSAYQGKQLEYDQVYAELRKTYEENQQLKQSQTQLAIKELEKVKEWLEPKYFNYEQINYLTRIIDNQIKELKGRINKYENN